MNHKDSISLAGYDAYLCKSIRHLIDHLGLTCKNVCFHKPYELTLPSVELALDHSFYPVKQACFTIVFVSLSLFRIFLNKDVVRMKF
jgi:hypothetical protein